MAFNIGNVLNAMEGRDFARPNLFEVEIPFLGDGIKFKCRAAAMPAAEVGVINVGYMNRKYKVMGDRVFSQWQITVYADEVQSTRDQFIAWQALGQSMGRTSAGGTPDIYPQVAYIRRFDRNGEVAKEYEIQECWPLTVGEVALDWDTNDQIETFDVNLELNSWE